jgi:hypothetical protein
MVLLVELQATSEAQESVRAAKINRFFFIMFTSYKRKPQVSDTRVPQEGNHYSYWRRCWAIFAIAFPPATIT